MMMPLGLKLCLFAVWVTVTVAINVTPEFNRLELTLLPILYGLVLWRVLCPDHFEWLTSLAPRKRRQWVAYGFFPVYLCAYILLRPLAEVHNLALVVLYVVQICCGVALGEIWSNDDDDPGKRAWKALSDAVHKIVAKVAEIHGPQPGDAA